MKSLKRVFLGGAVALALALFASAARADVPLGVIIEDTPNGVYVVDVFRGGIADRCMPRLRHGARIVTVNGDKLTSGDQFRQIVESSTFVRFQFVDATGELRWARAWSGQTTQLDCGR
jgi:S1-C subfamily serine protease